MPQINELSSLDTLSPGDQLPVYAQSFGDARKSSISVLQQYMQDNLTFPTFTGQGEFTTQYAAPSATAFSVTITDGASDNTNVHLILTPTAGFDDGTIVLPPVAGVVDKQEVLVNCTQQVTTLVVDGNGAAAVTGEPTALAADDFFSMKYDAVTDAWYRVG